MQARIRHSRHAAPRMPAAPSIAPAASAAADAEFACRLAVRRQPGNADAHYNLGCCLQAGGRCEEAAAAYRAALQIDPTHVRALCNLGNALRDGGSHGEAEDAYRQAIELNPGHASAWANLATLLHDQGRTEAAEASYRQALALRPEDAGSRLNLGLLLLAAGRFEEGWPLYEARHENLPQLPFARWQGEALSGRSILLWPEQGFGDEIQFARYAPLLKAHGAARVSLACRPQLANLLSTLAGVDAVIPLQGSVELPRHDYWSPLLSVPMHLGTRADSIPAGQPYLSAPAGQRAIWQARLPGGRPRVGLVWKGSTEHRNDRQRSLPGLATLAPLWRVPGIDWISLQKGAGEDEAASPPAGQPLLHLGGDIRDFADSAAIVAGLDLLICVDTAIAHLAGALGRPCWLLLPQRGIDWRWPRSGVSAPWYPGYLRLFQQPADGGRPAQIEALVRALAAWRDTV